MRHSIMQKDERANYRVHCSGSKLCYACKHERRKNKRTNNKAMRLINKEIIRQEIIT